MSSPARRAQRGEVKGTQAFHVTQHGNRREPIFFEDGDQDTYRDMPAEQMAKARVEIGAYCFMPNHVHRIAVPQDCSGLARAIGETHRRYANFNGTQVFRRARSRRCSVMRCDVRFQGISCRRIKSRRFPAKAQSCADFSGYSK